MATRGDTVHDLVAAVRGVRAAAAELTYPLPLPSAAPARAARAALLSQADDYLLPRLSRLDAPLLMVVSGSTGAGKSTLINSLVQAPVSPAGVLRPTTRVPVLVCHPADTAWFRSGAPLGALLRTAEVGSAPQLISAPALHPGLAFVDAPDFDAVVEGNRTIAQRLLAAADLWLFVTTAARYADAVPWDLLRGARERGTVVAMVLDRVPQPAGAGATVEVVGHLTELLAGHGLTHAPLFVLPESPMGGLGLLPEEAIGPLRTWFESLAADRDTRATLARYAVDGALAALPPRLEALAVAAEEQVAAAEALAERVGMAYGGARATVERTVRESAPPALVRSAPPPLAAAALPPAAAHRRSEPSPAPAHWWDRLAGPHGAGPDHRRAWEERLVTLVCSAAADAAEQAQAGWLEHPAGQEMLAPGLAGPSVGLAGKVARLARAWHAEAPEELLHRIGELLDTEAARWLDGLAGVPPDQGPAERLRSAAAALELARHAAGLTAPAAGAAGGSGAASAELDRAGR